MPLEIRLFGELRVEWDGLPVPAPRVGTAFLLLSILALRDGQEVSREWLSGMLWPESNDPLGTLRRTLTDLRRTLGEASSLVASPTVQTLRLNVEECRIDVREFKAAAARADIDSLETAIELYRGDLLESSLLPWIVQQRSVLQQTFLKVLEQAAAHHRKGGDLAKAAAYLQRAVAIDEYGESLHRSLMETLAEQGEVAEALLVYRNLRLLLHRDLSAEPSPETTKLFRRLRGGTGAPTEPVEPAPKSRFFRVPHPLTPFVAREDELREIAVSLERARLVTLTGFGGIGKTRLAIESCARLSSRFSDGVLFAELAALCDPERIVPAILAALEVRDDGSRTPLEQLKNALLKREFLLVLDNCEHLLEACAALAGALLKECPELRILTTSRQALGLTGEAVLRIPTLAVPTDLLPAFEPKDVTDFVARFPAIRLFAERVEAVQPAFQVTPTNLPTIVRLCHDLDGIPLALELAAARVRALSVDQILRRMADRFGLLSQGSTGALPHQQTLRATIEWSYDLLSEAERELFRRLSVFSNGFTLELAEAVCCEEGASRVHDAEVMDLLIQLVDKSLVQSEPLPDGTRRYRMLETVREYAVERSEAAHQDARDQNRLRDYFLSVLEGIYANRKGPGEKLYLDTIQTEYGNILSSISWCLKDAESGESALLLAGYLQDFWWIRGHLQEGQRLLEAALARPQPPAPSRARAFALRGSAVILWIQGKLDEASSILEESLAIRRSLGDDREAAVVMVNLGSVYRDKHEFAKSRAYQEESLAVFRGLNLRLDMASALTNLGSAALHQGDLEYAQRCYEEAVALRREMGDLRGVAVSLCGLAQVYDQVHQVEKALLYFDESLRLLREFNDRTNITITLLSIGKIRVSRGELEIAFGFLMECLDICAEIGDPVAAKALVSMGRLYYLKGDHALAAKLLAVSELSSTPGYTMLSGEELVDREETNANLRNEMEAAQYAKARSEAAGLDVPAVCQFLQ